jgi:M6 family metalloprotease-like protein
MKTKTWKTACSVVLMLLLGGAAALAAPFAKQISFTQPDGTQIELWAEGDEFYAVFETLDGYAVAFDPATEAYQYAQLSPDGDDLLPSGAEVGKADPQALRLETHLRIKPEAVKKKARERYQRWDEATGNSARWKALKAARRQAEMGAAPATVNDAAQPAPPSSTTTGTRVGLCLLVDFDDDPATIPQPDINNFCNGDNYGGYGNNGSVKQYFSDNSNGGLAYENVVTIYIRIPNSLHRKRWYDDTRKDCGIQGNLLVRDAVAIMKARKDYESTILPTFAKLSVPYNNRVRACNVYYAGGNRGVWAKGLWPNCNLLTDVGEQDLGNGMKLWCYQISDIGTSPELGTFCHENGHMLCGFPDIYDYDYDSVGGAGAFCLMGYGSYAKNPVQICAYLKRAAGWLVTADLTSDDSLTATLPASYSQVYRYYKPPDVTGDPPTEYFLLENRQHIGRDANLPASGIAVWHIDELGDHNNQSLTPNNTHANYEVTLVQADNQWHFQNNVNAGDLQDLYFSGNPAAGYSNSLNDDTAPDALWWDGTPSGLKLNEFSPSYDVMTVQVGGETPPPPPLLPPAAPTDLRGSASKTAITLTWVDNADNENGFYVERSTVSVNAGFTRIYTTGPNWTTCVNQVGARRGTYYYRVQAFNNTTGTSAYSNPVVVQK